MRPHVIAKIQLETLRLTCGASPVLKSVRGMFFHVLARAPIRSCWNAQGNISTCLRLLTAVGKINMYINLKLPTWSPTLAETTRCSEQDERTSQTEFKFNCPVSVLIFCRQANCPLLQPWARIFHV